MTSALVPLGDMERMASAIAASNLFGMKTKDQALALMIVAQAENRHPGSVAAEYHIIQNRPALKADAMLARFQQAGGLVEWEDYTDKKVSAKFSHSVNAPKPVLIEWTFDMAQKAGLTGKDNWKNYPRQMLRARVISEGVRTVFPAVAVGVYTPEEVQDFEREINPNPRRQPRLPKAQAEDANVVIESTAASTPPESEAEIPPSAAGGGAPKTRADKLSELCIEAGGSFSVMGLCEKAGVLHVDEMSQTDYESAVAMLRRVIIKKGKK